MNTLIHVLLTMKKIITIISLFVLTLASQAQTVLGSHPDDRFQNSFWTNSHNNPFRIFNSVNLYNGGTNRFVEGIMPETMATDAEVSAAIAPLATTNFVLDVSNRKSFVLTNTIAASSTNWTIMGASKHTLNAKDVIRITAAGYCNAGVGAKLMMAGGLNAIEFDLGAYVGYWRLSGTITARSGGFAFDGIVQTSNGTALIQSGFGTDDIAEWNTFKVSGKVYTLGFSDYIDCSTLLIEKL